MIVEELVAKLGLEVSSDATNVLEKFKSSISSGLGGIAALGTAAVGALAAVVGTAANAADEIGDISDRLGVAPQALQELKFAAEQSEASFEGLQTGLKFIATNAVEAANGNAELAKAFKGVTLKNATGGFRTANELLTDMADKFVGLDAASSINLARKLFGKSGDALIPLLKKGSAGIAELTAKAHQLGVVFSDEDIAQAGRFDDALKDVRAALTGLRNELGSRFFGGVAKGMEFLLALIIKMRPVINAVGEGFTMAAEIVAFLVGAVQGLGERLAESLGLNGLDKLFTFKDLLKVISRLVAALALAFTVMGVQMALAFVVSAAPFAALLALVGFVVSEIYSLINGTETLTSRFIKWASVLDPSGNPIIEFFKSLVTLVFDLTNPANWVRIIDAWETLAQAWRKLVIGAFTGAFEFIAGKLGAFFGGIGDFISGKFSALKGSIFGGSAPSSAPINLKPFGPSAESAQSPGGVPLTSSNSTSDNRSVAQTNNVTINAAGMSPEELKNQFDKYSSSQYQEAFASTPR